MSTDVYRCDRLAVEIEPDRYGTYSVFIRLYLGDRRVHEALHSTRKPRAAAIRDMAYAQELISLRLSRGIYVFVSGESPDVKVD
jgi:hypothetical protein